MVITALLLYVVAIERWHWPKPAAFLVIAIFLTIDSHLRRREPLKVFQGDGALLIGTCIFTA